MQQKNTDQVFEMANGYNRVFIAETLAMLSFDTQRWGGIEDDMGPAPKVDKLRVFNNIARSVLLVSTEHWRRLVQPYEKWPYPLIKVLLATEKLTEKSATRAQTVKDFLDECEWWLDGGSRVVRRVLLPYFQACVESGGVLAECVVLFMKTLFSMAPYETQDIEGNNSIIARIMMLAASPLDPFHAGIRSSQPQEVRPDQLRDIPRHDRICAGGGTGGGGSVCEAAAGGRYFQKCQVGSVHPGTHAQ